jgi:hypothetical protein
MIRIRILVDVDSSLDSFMPRDTDFIRLALAFGFAPSWFLIETIVLLLFRSRVNIMVGCQLNIKDDQYHQAHQEKY